MIPDSELHPLIDCDILVYRCGFAADAQVKRDLKSQNPGIGDDDLAAKMQELDYVHYALGNTKEVMDDVIRQFHPEYRAFLSGSGNFREQMATILPYKGNRDPTHKPKYYREIKDYLRDVWGAEVVNGREADDAIGCAQWAAKDRDTIIVSIDKDLDMIPGPHYNWVKNFAYDVSLNNANLMLFYQMLTGDRTDNIPGIPGIGPKTADRMIENLKSELPLVRAAVQQAYKKYYGADWETFYDEVAALLWIQRVPDKECPFLR